MGNYIDITGKQYGKLTVVEFAYKKGSRTYWRCSCECGNDIIVRSDSIKNGHAKSCGCLKIEKLRNNPPHYIHGQRHTRVYRIWSEMLTRCYNKNIKGYSNYGRRGIFVCEQWHDFKNFYDWAMANGYTDRLTIDRIDNNGSYCPENCRWATQKQQSNNRRTNQFYIVANEKLTIAQIAEKYCIDYKLLWNRLKKNWDIEKAIDTPKREFKR